MDAAERRFLVWLFVAGLVAFVVLTLLIFVVGEAEGAQAPSLRPLFDALWAEEGSSSLKPADGDGGTSIGPYQIGYAYWLDARMPDGTWQDCRDKVYAERVMKRYWQRYRATTDEQRARMHNGGPRGPKRKSTLAYWRRVKARLEKDSACG